MLEIALHESCPGLLGHDRYEICPAPLSAPGTGDINTRVVENVEGSPPTPCARVRGLPHGCSAPTV